MWRTKTNRISEENNISDIQESKTSSESVETAMLGFFII